MDPSHASTRIHRAGYVYAAGVGAFAVLAAVVLLADNDDVLRVFGFDLMPERWADARTISGAGIALDQGLDPLVDNPGDPWGRVLNYPRIWLLPARLGLRPEHTPVLAASFLLAGLVGLLSLQHLVRERNTAWILLLGAIAPTTWFAAERANSDLLMFGLVAWACVRASSHPRLAVVLTAVASLLKLYPIAGVAALLGHERRATWRRVTPLLVAFAAYTWAIGGDLQRIHEGTASAPHLAYGVRNMPTWLAKNTDMPFAGWLALMCLALVGVLAVAVRMRRSSRLGESGSAASQAAFRAGAAIYLCTFLVGECFDYRLLFLLLTIPQLCTWAATGTRRVRRLAAIMLCIVLLLQWSLCWRQILASALGAQTTGLAVDECLSWFAWCGFAMLGTLSLPDGALPQSFGSARYLDENPT